MGSAMEADINMHPTTHLYHIILLLLMPFPASPLAAPTKNPLPPAFPSATPYPLGDVKHTLDLVPEYNIQSMPGSTPDSPFDINHEIANFVKATYKDLGDNNGSVTQTITNSQEDFNKLNALMNGELAEVLSTVFDIRTLELEMSLEHTRTMQEVVAGLAAHPHAVRGLP